MHRLLAIAIQRPFSQAIGAVTHGQHLGAEAGELVHAVVICKAFQSLRRTCRSKDRVGKKAGCVYASGSGPSHGSVSIKSFCRRLAHGATAQSITLTGRREHQVLPTCCVAAPDPLVSSS